MTNNRESEALMNLKDDVKRKLSKEDTKALWEGVFDEFESGGEHLDFINRRFDPLKRQILTKIEEIKRHLPED